MIKLYATDRKGGSDTAFYYRKYLYAPYRRKGGQHYADCDHSYVNICKVLIDV